MTDRIRKLPAPFGGRVESGPVQFGDDWPGVFIRGDNAAYYCHLLDRAIEAMSKVDPLGAVVLGGLQDTIAASDLTRPPSLQPGERQQP